VPHGYTGNVVLWAWPAAMVGNLMKKTLRHTVEVINRVVNQIDDAYFKGLFGRAPLILILLGDDFLREMIPWLKVII
jgi:hypothetical protein